MPADDGISLLRSSGLNGTDAQHIYRYMLLGSVRKTGRACIVHEDNLTGGVGAEVPAIIAKDAFDYLDAPVHPVAPPDVPSFPYSPTLEHALLPGPPEIVRAGRELVTPLVVDGGYDQVVTLGFINLSASKTPAKQRVK